MIQAQSFLQFPELSHGFSDVSDGNMDYRFGAQPDVESNRRRYLDKLGLNLDHAVQQRGLEAEIHSVTSADRGIGMKAAETGLKANTFITKQPGIALFLCIADCLPIMIYDSQQHVVALLHAARNSTNLMLTTKVVQTLMDHYNCHPQDMWVVCGPAIRSKSYVFDEPVISDLVGPEWRPFMQKLPNGRVAVDVPAYNHDQLLKAGVPAAQIEDLSINTRTDSRFFSHVRSVEEHLPEGRFAAVVALKTLA